MARRRCKGKTKAGKRCTRRGVEWCAQHIDQAPAAARAAARAPDTKRPPKKARARGKDDWRPRFLAALAEHVVVVDACKAAGVSQSNVYDERRRNEKFAEAWAEIEEQTIQRMEREGFRRAVEGWIERTEYEYHEVDGELQRFESLQVRKFSDTLLIFLLKARRPNVYRERVEHTGAGGGPLEHRVKVDLSKLTDEQLAALEAIHAADSDSAEQG